jgi:hypothetical protein
VVQLYVSGGRRDVVIRAINVLTLLAQRGATDVWMGYPLIHSLVEQFCENLEAMVALLHLLQFMPSGMFKLLTDTDFMTPLVRSLKLGYRPDDLQIVLYLLFGLAHSIEAAAVLVDHDIVELCMDLRTAPSFMLLSRLCNSLEGSRRIDTLGGLPWVLGVLGAADSPLPMVNAAMVIAGRLLVLSCAENRPDLAERSEVIVDLLMPIVLAHSKTAEVVGLAYGVLAVAVEFVAPRIIEKRAVQAASVMLSIHSKDLAAAINLVTFIFACVEAGLAEHVKQVRAAVPTIVKSIQDHPDCDVLVERAVGVAILCGHPDGPALLNAALQKFNDSEFLRRFVTPPPTE